MPTFHAVVEVVPIVTVEGPASSARMSIGVLDPTLDRAPTSLVVVVDGGLPNAVVTFEIDGDEVYTATLDSEGNLGPTSIPVDAEHGTVGAHTITVLPEAGDGVTVGGSAAFTLGRGPNMTAANQGDDIEPVDVGALVGDVYRWVLQDLQPGGLGSYIFPRNPRETDPWPFSRVLTQRTVLQGDKVHVYSGGKQIHDGWSFKGWGNTEDFYDKLVAYSQIKRRIYLHDHRNRAWRYAITELDIKPRLRIMEDDGSFNDWTFDYTVRGIIYGDDWQVPQ